MIVLTLPLPVGRLRVAKIMVSLEPGTNYFSKLMLKLELGQMGGTVRKYTHNRTTEIVK